MTYWRYNVYQVDEEVGGQNSKGRYFTFTREFVEKIIREKDSGNVDALLLWICGIVENFVLATSVVVWRFHILHKKRKE